MLPGGFSERGERSLGASHDRMQQSGGHQRAQSIRAHERHCLLQAFDRFVPAHAVKGAVRQLQQTTEERAVFANDARHIAHRVRVAVDGGHELRQERRPARQVLRLEFQVTEHARGRLEFDELRWSCLVAQFAKTHIECVGPESPHGDIRVRTRRLDTVGGTHRVRLVLASLPIVDHPRAHPYTRFAEPLIHKRADPGADSGNHG